MRSLRLLALAASISSVTALTGCDTPVMTTDVPGTDTGVPGEDTGLPGEDTGTPDDAGTDGGGGTGCGTETADVSGVTGTEGLVVARDGTIYYSQSEGVGRLTPGGSPEDDFVALPGADTVWGMVLDEANETLFVGSPSTASIYAIDLAAPADDVLVSGVGQPNGLTLGPDGAIYFSNFGAGAVRRIETTGGTPTTVTTSGIPGANGVAFDAEGRLLVASYSSGRVFRLTLTAGAETGREEVANGVGSPDGIALDANGDLWVANNAGSLYFVDMSTVPGTEMAVIPSGIPSAASLDFGAGPLDCEDLYIASAGAARRHPAGVAGADVPWH